MSGSVTNAITVDVENWCHASCESFADLPPGEQRGGVMRGLEILVDLLARHGHRATFFVLGTVAEAVPDAVRLVRDAGHEIGSHGHDHRRIDESTPGDLERDLRRSKEVLERAANAPVVAYRSPKWSLYPARRWATHIVAKAGFRCDSSLYPIPHVGNPSLPRVPYDLRTEHGTLTEFPPLCGRGIWAKYPMGGTWGLRTFHYSGIARSVRKANLEGHPAVFHLHPWEVDPWRPPLRQPFLTRLAITVRFTDLRKRLDRLLGDFPFAPLTETVDGQPRPVLTPEELP